MKFEEIWPRDFREEVVQMCERMDGHSHKCTLVGYFNSKKITQQATKMPLKYQTNPQICWKLFLDTNTINSKYST